MVGTGPEHNLFLSYRTSTEIMNFLVELFLNIKDILKHMRVIHICQVNCLWCETINLSPWGLYWSCEDLPNLKTTI